MFGRLTASTIRLCSERRRWRLDNAGVGCRAKGQRNDKAGPLLSGDEQLEVYGYGKSCVWGRLTFSDILRAESETVWVGIGKKMTKQ